MYTHLFVMLLLAFGQTPPSKVALERECKGVPDDKLTLVRQAAEDKAKSGASAGTVTRSAREAAKVAGVAENCAVELARFAFADYGKDTRPRDASGKLITKNEAKRIEGWESLTEAEQEWRLWELQGGKLSELNWGSLRVGQRGRFGGYAFDLKVASVVSESDVLAICRAWYEWRENLPEKRVKAGEDKALWISGYATKGLIDGQPLDIREIVNVTGTKTYTDALGTSRTALLVEVIHFDSDRLAQVLPPQSVLDELNKARK